jgi:hypothetical protein
VYLTGRKRSRKTDIICGPELGSKCLGSQHIRSNGLQVVSSLSGMIYLTVRTATRTFGINLPFAACRTSCFVSPRTAVTDRGGLE